MALAESVAMIATASLPICIISPFKVLGVSVSIDEFAGLHLVFGAVFFFLGGIPIGFLVSFLSLYFSHAYKIALAFLALWLLSGVSVCIYVYLTNPQWAFGSVIFIFCAYAILPLPFLWTCQQWLSAR
jgi:hypothetical protein